jgi:hypothetical protein
MSSFAKIVVLLVLATVVAAAADDRLMESARSANDLALDTNSVSAFWRGARPVCAHRHGIAMPRYRTGIRSRWTKAIRRAALPQARPKLSPLRLFSPGVWNVAEVFIGSKFQNIKRYKEFELSPQGEWIDLDIDLSTPHHENGWSWNSGFQVAARVDGVAKIWYGAMRIPFSAFDQRPPTAGNTFRINLFRMQGQPPDRNAITWQPSMSESFHVPERFGLLRLVKQ